MVNQYFEASQEKINEMQLSVVPPTLQLKVSHCVLHVHHLAFSL